MDQQTREILETFRSKMKALEVIALLEDKKRCVRQGFYEEELPKVNAFCRRNGLFLVTSPFKIVLADGDSTFSNKGIMVDAKDPRRGMFFAYISKGEMTSLRSLYFEVKKDHRNLGLSLGYPDCCCDFFASHEPDVSKQDGNYEKACLANSEGVEFPFQNNILQRDKDRCILSHFPCSLECLKSKDQADIMLKLADQKFPEYAAELRKELKGDFSLYGRKIMFV